MINGLAQLRPFTRADIPAVVGLRQQVFRRTAQPSTEDLSAYFARTFLDHPWRSLGLDSIVHLAPSGEVNGFVGVFPRRMRFRDRTLRVAVPTQLMVRPGTPAGAGVRLARCVLEGPQDATISDVANDAARGVWTRAAGATALVHSLFWGIPLRPARHAMAQLGAGIFGRAIGLLARPLCQAFDATYPVPTAADVQTEVLDPERHLPEITAIAAMWPLHPEYDLAGFRWQMEETGRKRENGPLVARVVRDARGHAIGWYLFHANRGGVGEVVQLGARPGDQWRVLAPLLVEARAAGVVTVSGRLEPALLGTLAARRVTFTREGPWFLTYARDPALLAAITGGASFLSRFEGEWWLNF